MLALSLLSLFVIKKLHQHNELKTELSEYLCIKEYNGVLQSYVSFMQKSNWAIKNIDRIDKVLWPFPSLKLASGATKSIEVALKRMQEVKTISVLQKFVTLKRKNCPISPNALIPPYNVVKRSPNGEARLRRKKWQLIFFGKKILKQKMHISQNTLKIKSYQIQ